MTAWVKNQVELGEGGGRDDVCACVTFTTHRHEHIDTRRHTQTQGRRHRHRGADTDTEENANEKRTERWVQLESVWTKGRVLEKLDKLRNVALEVDVWKVGHHVRHHLEPGVLGEVERLAHGANRVAPWQRVIARKSVNEERACIHRVCVYVCVCVCVCLYG